MNCNSKKHASLRCLELFSGIGGFAAAVSGSRFKVVGAIDINRLATGVYQKNFLHPVAELTLESISLERLAQYQADFWWLSPPCQPFTSRGLGRDSEDPRSQALIQLLSAIERLQPAFVLLENVGRFGSSRMAAKMRETLHRLGYQTFECLICPTQIGIANRRLRYYLVATKQPEFTEFPLEQFAWNEEIAQTPCQFHSLFTRRVQDVLIEANWNHPELRVAPNLVDRYAESINWVDIDDSQAISCCFTSAYAKSPVYSGSYLRRGNQVRYFCPLEIARLLGFSPAFEFPSELTFRQRWNLIGNSLSVDVVRMLLKQLELTLGTP